jgi:hypothetical protein
LTKEDAYWRIVAEHAKEFGFYCPLLPNIGQGFFAVIMSHESSSTESDRGNGE